MNLRELIEQGLREQGADGLYNFEMQCSCCIGDLEPCGTISLDCESAICRTLGPNEYLGDCGPGDFWCTPLGDTPP